MLPFLYCRSKLQGLYSSIPECKSRAYNSLKINLFLKKYRSISKSTDAQGSDKLQEKVLRAKIQRIGQWIWYDY